MAGVPHELSLADTIVDLFENERIVYKNGLSQLIYYSHLRLSSDQATGLKYPEGFHPVGFYILDQVEETFNNQTSKFLSMVSFCKKKKCDPFYYGVYFRITNQEPFSQEELTENKCPVELSKEAIFTIESNFLETYNDVAGISSFSDISTSPTYSSFGYRYHGRLYYEFITLNGLSTDENPPIELIGLSKNLKCLGDIDERICQK